MHAYCGLNFVLPKFGITMGANYSKDPQTTLDRVLAAPQPIPGALHVRVELWHGARNFRQKYLWKGYSGGREAARLLNLDLRAALEALNGHDAGARVKMQHGRALVLVGQTVEPKMVLGLGRPIVMSFRWYIDGEGKNKSLESFLKGFAESGLFSKGRMTAGVGRVSAERQKPMRGEKRAGPMVESCSRSWSAFALGEPEMVVVGGHAAQMPARIASLHEQRRRVLLLVDDDDDAAQALYGQCLGLVSFPDMFQGPNQRPRF